MAAAAAAAAAAGATPLVTAAFLLLPLRLLSLAFSLRLTTFPPVAPARRSAVALLTVAALLTVTCAIPDAGSSPAPEAEAIRSEISELRLKLARLESILEENMKTSRSKAYTLEEENKLTEAMENDIQLLRNEESYSESNIYIMEDEAQILQQEVRKINNIAYTIESLAIDAEKRVEFLSSEVKKIESIITEQWIQIRQFEQAFVVTKMMTSKVHKRRLSDSAYKWSGKDMLLKYVRNVDLHGVFLAGVSHIRTCVSHTYKHCRSFIQVMKRCYHKASKFHKAIQYQCSPDVDVPNAFFLDGSISRSCISLPYEQFKISISSAQQIHYKVQVYLQDAMRSNIYSRGIASEPVTFCLAYLIVISPLWVVWFLFSSRFGSSI